MFDSKSDHETLVQGIPPQRAPQDRRGQSILFFLCVPLRPLRWTVPFIIVSANRTEKWLTEKWLTEKWLTEK